MKIKSICLVLIMVVSILMQAINIKTAEAVLIEGNTISISDDGYGNWNYTPVYTITAPQGSYITSFTFNCTINTWDVYVQCSIDGGPLITGVATSDPSLKPLSSRVTASGIRATTIDIYIRGDYRYYLSGSYKLSADVADYQTALEAKNAAVDAKNAANTASTNATNALNILNGASNGGKSLAATYDRANSANSNASTAAARVWDATESKSAAQLAKEARDKANANYQELQNLKTSITNIENTLAAGDSTPPTILSIKGYNGATCTTGSTFSVTVQAFDNSGTLEFRVMADTGTWSDWVPISSYNTAGGITGTGAHTLTVEVRDSAGNVSTGTMTFFKL